ncbi:hypothetical protein ACWDA3_04575 [Nonomuraea rubra]
MNHTDDAQAGLEEIARRRGQVIAGASRGRHRGWDAAGLILMIAGFAAMDLPVARGLQLGLLGVAVVAALACFTRAGHRSSAVIHPSQVTGRFWALLGGCALFGAVFAIVTMWLVRQSGFPLGHTMAGVIFAALVAAGQPLYRAVARRVTA